MNSKACPSVITGRVVPVKPSTCNDGATHLLIQSNPKGTKTRLRGIGKDVTTKLKKASDTKMRVSVGGSFVSGPEPRCNRLDVRFVMATAKVVQDMVAAARLRTSGGGLPQPILTRNWHAENNRMPSPKRAVRFQVAGEVNVPNRGVAVILKERAPQGINLRILLLDLKLTRELSNSSPRGVWKKAEYRKRMTTEPYQKVAVFYKNKQVQMFPVIDVD